MLTHTYIYIYIYIYVNSCEEVSGYEYEIRTISRMDVIRNVCDKLVRYDIIPDERDKMPVLFR